MFSLALGLGYYYQNTSNQNIAKVEMEKVKLLVDGYISQIWDKHHSVLLRLSALDLNKWKNYREFYLFMKDSKNYFKDNTLNDASLYSVDGELIFSTIENNNFKPESNHLFEKAKSGSFDYKIIDDHKIMLMFPIISDENEQKINGSVNNVEAIATFKINVKESFEQISKFQIILIGTIIALFGLLLLFMVLFSKRAESIISKQHEINLELAAAASAAESENRDKSMFLANISHELRTPLNAIIGFSDILSNDLDGRLDLQHKEYLRDINSSGKHLLSLINDILEFSKAEAGKLEVDLSEIDAVKMVKNTIRLMIPRADEAQVTMQEELPKQSFIMHTDAKKMKQILLNLLSNSVKFTPASGKVKITAWHDAARNRAIFIVSDTGIGIAPKDISKVMSPFGQVDSELSRRYEGTGLGLPLTKKLVELLGGTFKIESEVGVGTTITLDFPVRLERKDIGS